MESNKNNNQQKKRIKRFNYIKPRGAFYISRGVAFQVGVLCSELFKGKKSLDGLTRVEFYSFIISICKLLDKARACNTLKTQEAFSLSKQVGVLVFSSVLGVSLNKLCCEMYNTKKPSGIQLKKTRQIIERVLLQKFHYTINGKSITAPLYYCSFEGNNYTLTLSPLFLYGIDNNYGTIVLDGLSKIRKSEAFYLLLFYLCCQRRGVEISIKFDTLCRLCLYNGRKKGLYESQLLHIFEALRGVGMLKDYKVVEGIFTFCG